MNFEENTEDFDNPDSGLSASALLIQRIYARTSNFVGALQSLKKSSEHNGEETEKVGDLDTPDGPGRAEEAIRTYFDFSYVFGPDGKINGAKNPVQLVFDSNSYENVNCPNLPDLTAESGKGIIVMEFFTHCCINCIHSIEDLREVSEEIANHSNRQDSIETGTTKSFNCGLKFISIHSPKFTREKDSESIKAFTKRMRMDYSDVINDPGCILWNTLGICCWPTILIFGPNPQGSGPNLLFTFMGEGHKDVLRFILKSSTKYLEDKFVFRDKPMRALVNTKSVIQSDTAASTFLKYPGKVTCFGDTLAIADSGHNRIIISSLNGTIQHVVGGISKGYENGDFQSTRFYNPQGIAFHDDDTFYVADTGNHAIRKVDLKTKTVTTLVPPGSIVEMIKESVVLKSPWDLAFYSQNVLLVAAAGNHRIFGYFFESVKIFNTEHPKHSFSVVAGSGREENRNNSYILNASFAQPSGICVSQGANETDITVYIADSESSSIRAINSTGKVVGIVGGARDPTDLFAYGDVDGKGYDVKMQHPMGVCWSSPSSIFTVDTYNHKVKKVNLGTKDKECNTIIGDGISGNQLGGFSSEKSMGADSLIARLNEPSGIYCDDTRGVIYIADTNNHAIKVANLSEGVVKEISFTLPNHVPDVSSKALEVTPECAQIFDVAINPGIKTINLQTLILDIPKHFGGGQWNLQGIETSVKYSGDIIKNSETDVGKLNIELPVTDESRNFKLHVDIFFCNDSACYKKTLKFLIRLLEQASKDDKSGQSSSPITLSYKPKKDYFIQ